MARTAAARPIVTPVAATPARRKFVMPNGLKLSPNTLRALPTSEKATAAERLWTKSGGLCALCSQPLDSEGALIQDGLVEPDHVVPKHSGRGGKDVLANLFLAHRHCNRLRGDKPYELAKRYITFSVWAAQNAPIHFADVLDKYVTRPNQNAIYHRSGDRIVLDFGAFKSEASIAKDPATIVEYFFVEVPVTHIFDDTPVQPRAIDPAQVEGLAADFVVHPVHEPSNVRMTFVGTTVCKLSQFDGQHKTSAQIVLGRDRVPLKVYIDPPVALLQDLVLSVQDRIRKLRLSTSDTLTKLGDVIKARLELYKAPEGGSRSEKAFVESRPVSERRSYKTDYLRELDRIILTDETNRMRLYAAPKRTTDKPLTDTVLVNKLIRPLIYSDLLAENMDEPGGRDNERKAILLILNTIVDELLAKGWAKRATPLDRRRASNFMYQGSIAWWLPQVLLPAIFTQLRVKKSDELTRFLKPLSTADEDDIKQLIIALVNWDIWSKDESSVEVAAMRSNTAARVADAFPEKSHHKLLDDARNNP